MRSAVGVVTVKDCVVIPLGMVVDDVSLALTLGPSLVTGLASIYLTEWTEHRDGVRLDFYVQEKRVNLLIEEVVIMVLELHMSLMR